MVQHGCDSSHNSKTLKRSLWTLDSEKDPFEIQNESLVS